MDTRLIYHEVIPTNLKSSYTEFDVVDFQMSHPDRKLNLGSVRITGELNVQYDGNNLNSDTVIDGTHVNGKQIYLDHLVGAHALCEAITCSVNAGGSKQIIENIAVDYARYVKMATATTSGRNDMLNSNNVCELKAVDQGLTNAVMQGVIPPTDPTSGSQRVDPDFSFRPLCAFNGGSGTLGYNKTGDCEVSITLARTFSVLYGNDVNSKVKYSVKNLRLLYSTSPMDDDNDPVLLKTKLAIKQSIQSSFANVRTRVPAVCSAVSCSFQVQANENTATNNNQELNKVPNLSQTQFLFNDSTNTLVSYIIKSDSELTDKFIDSMVDTGRNALNTQNLAANNGFGIGLDFDQLVPLQNQVFSIQLQSGISSVVPMVIYMYFHSFVEL